MDLDLFQSRGFKTLMDLLSIWSRRDQDREASENITDAIAIVSAVARYQFYDANRRTLRRYLRNFDSATVAEFLGALTNYSGKGIGRLKIDELSEAGVEFISAPTVADALQVISDRFEGLRFDSEKAEEDIFFTDPPIEQLAEMARSENLTAADLIKRLNDARDRMQYYQGADDEYSTSDVTDHEGLPLHLMTATRAKGKEFETVILLDTVDNVWPHHLSKPRAEEVEAERRLFYVAFTRARERVILLLRDHDQPSPFVAQLGLPDE